MPPADPQPTHAPLVVPMPVRDHLRCCALEWVPARSTADCDALEESLRLAEQQRRAASK